MYTFIAILSTQKEWNEINMECARKTSRHYIQQKVIKQQQRK